MIDWEFVFEIIREVVSLPNDAVCIAKYYDGQDHMEQLWIDKDGHFYRYAGGGRGFFWTQEIRMISAAEGRSDKLIISEQTTDEWSPIER